MGIDDQSSTETQTKNRISGDEKIILETLIKYHTHYDVFIWNRPRYIAPLQGAAIAGAYSLKDSNIFFSLSLLIIIGIAGTLSLYYQGNRMKKKSPLYSIHWVSGMFRIWRLSA